VKAFLPEVWLVYLVIKYFLILILLVFIILDTNVTGFEEPNMCIDIFCNKALEVRSCSKYGW